MPNSLKARLGKLKYKGIISDKDYERLCKALEQEPKINAVPMTISKPEGNVVYGRDGNLYELTLSNGKEYEQEPCEDCISRKEAIMQLQRYGVGCFDADDFSVEQCTRFVISKLRDLPSVTPQPNMRHCKDCKYFEYDSVAIVDGIPLIVAHEICSKWGNGCKTSEDGYCFLFEPLEESEVEE